MLTDRVPGRRSDPVQLVREAVTWWRVHEGEEAASQTARAQLAIDAVAFPAQPFADTNDGLLAVTAIRNAADLQTHSVEMQHCVYNEHVETAVAGDDCIYDCSYGGLRFTLAVRRRRGAWSFVAASGVRNRPLTTPEHEALDRWLASNGIATECDVPR